MRRRTALFVCTGLVCTGLVWANLAAAQISVDYRVLAYTGQEAPDADAGERFGSFEVPKINSAGDVLIDATLTSVGGVDATGVWVWSESEGLRLVVREGDPLPPHPGLSAEFLDVYVPRSTLTDDGEVAFSGRALRARPDGRFDATSGLWLAEGRNRIRRLIRADDPVPGLPDRTFSPLLANTIVSTRTRGSFQFSALFVPNIPGGEGLFVGSPEAGWSIVADESTDPFLREFTRFEFNRQGDGTLVSASSESISSVWSIRQGQLALIARAGTSLPLPHEFPNWGHVRNARINEAGTIAIQNQRDVWLQYPDGSYARLPLGAGRGNARELSLSDRGDVAVIAYLDAGVSGPRAVIALDGSEEPPPIAVRNEQVPGFDPGVRYANLGPIRIDSRGHVLFLTSLLGVGSDSGIEDEAMLFAPRGREPISIIAAGDVVEVAPGVDRIVRVVEVNPVIEAGPWSLDSGEVVVRVTFQDDDEAILLIQVPVSRDTDGDGVTDFEDNCPGAPNSDQVDSDGNGTGDACNDDEDRDGDDLADLLDNCPDHANADQSDTDGDGEGDACNGANDLDGDDFRDDLDNCPSTPNDQVDRDGDGVGDACDPFPFDADNVEAQLRVDLDRALAELAICSVQPLFVDADGDGEEDSTDLCPDTASGAEVDSSGCSRSEFCAAVGGRRGRGWASCYRLDWANDEPHAIFPGDCMLQLEGRRWFGLQCVASGAN